MKKERYKALISTRVTVEILSRIPPKIWELIDRSLPLDMFADHAAMEYYSRIREKSCDAYMMMAHAKAEEIEGEDFSAMSPPVIADEEGDFGFKRTRALIRLVNLYTGDSRFTREVARLRSNVRSIQTVNLKRSPGDLGRDIFTFEGDAGSYTISKWSQLWEHYQSTAPECDEKEVMGLADNWGLSSCKWGPGFIIDVANKTYPSMLRHFEFLPTPANYNGHPFLLPVNHFLTRRKLDDAVKSLAARAEIQRQEMRESLEDGYHTNDMGDLFRWKIYWLYLHITPNYLSPDEISQVMCEAKVNYGNNEYAVGEGYRAIAKLLNVKLRRGWHKGRRRDKTSLDRLKLIKEVAARLASK
ncbi:hypothetical protein ACFLX5_06325 [Chloroflexota bacterium]